MSGIRIITDSTADLTPELIERYNLKVVPLTVQFENQSYLDGLEINNEQLFARVAETKKLPTTAAPSPGAFLELFKEVTADGSEAIYIGISSKLSATLQNARLAAEMLPEAKIHIVDSLNLSTGIGLQVLLAADLAAAGHSAAAIVERLEAERAQVRTAFMVDTLDYLHMGGRCSAVTALFGTVLRIRPIIKVEEGAMDVATKLRGAAQKGADWMLGRLAEVVAAGQLDERRVIVTHTGVPELVDYMIAEVKRLAPSVHEVLETRAGSVIGSHCGPGTFGLIYKTK